MLAKVSRDRLMVKMEAEHRATDSPSTRATARRRTARRWPDLGPCSQHRYSFINVRRLVAVAGELVPEAALDTEPSSRANWGRGE